MGEIIGLSSSGSSPIHNNKTAPNCFQGGKNASRMEIIIVRNVRYTLHKDKVIIEDLPDPKAKPGNCADLFDQQFTIVRHDNKGEKDRVEDAVKAGQRPKGKCNPKPVHIPAGPACPPAANDKKGMLNCVEKQAINRVNRELKKTNNPADRAKLIKVLQRLNHVADS
ncbi:MAG: hypothetical protein HQ564_04065 [Candidatus Saganbacteria bacterium]|nr:hypothetical protein [Candidatus Saganbacteria bacterium]